MKRTILIILLVAAVFSAPAGWAAAGLDLNTFVADTPARAASVNENFVELEESIPVMWASIDQDPAAVAFTVATPGAVINSLPGIVVPEPGGILLINGSAFVNNDGAPQPLALGLLVNGMPADGHGFLAYYFPQGDGNFISEGFTLAYTYAYAAAAGIYTISQELKSTYGPSVFTYNKNNLTVIFFPNLPGGIPIQVPGIPAGGEPFPQAICEDGDLCP